METAAFSGARGTATFPRSWMDSSLFCPVLVLDPPQTLVHVPVPDTPLLNCLAILRFEGTFPGAG